MEQENNPEGQKGKNHLLQIGIIFSALIIALVWIYTIGIKSIQKSQYRNQGNDWATAQIVEFPVRWGDLGSQLISNGVIDQPRLEALYAERGGLRDADKRLLEDLQDGKLKVTQENSGFLLNLLWALGLSNKNAILEIGPMADSRYGGSDRFASTGGWTLAKGNVMDHYSKHQFITLTPEQQAMIVRVSKNIYRPCCDNSVYFPDCNHGMAMLGLLELLASQDASEEQMYRVALQMNAFWFPDQYATIENYFEQNSVDPRSVDPKDVLGRLYSSASGYQKIMSQVSVPERRQGGGCSV